MRGAMIPILDRCDLSHADGFAFYLILDLLLLARLLAELLVRTIQYESSDG